MSLVTHLWQSTLCAGIAALLAIALRHAPARVRHRVWLCASLKFLVPFSPLVALGSYIGAWISPPATSTVSIAVRWLDQSLSLWNLDATTARAASGALLDVDGVALLPLLLVWVSGAAGLTMWRWQQWLHVSRLARAATPLARGREPAALARVRRTSAPSRGIELLLCESNCEPGVLGTFRPRLLWPAGLSDRLSDAELEAVLAHELRHVERRDNLSALIQMAVEIVFWFHPVVWWVGARLVSERERACDEEVLQMGTDERQYAEGILKVCGFSVRAPSSLVAGVGGSDLSRRMERILGRRKARSLTLWTRVLIGGVVLLAAGAPLGTGVLNAHREVAPRSSPAPLERRAGAPTQDEGTVHRPGKGITMPKVVYDVKPDYTPKALQARIEGSVMLQAVVLETGAVGQVTIVQSLDTVHGLDDASVKAMKQWRFEPGTKDGKPVAVLVEVEMTFTLK